MIEDIFAKHLEYIGFPNITRWEIENNEIRRLSVSGEKTLPSIGCLMEEISNLIAEKGILDERIVCLLKFPNKDVEGDFRYTACMTDGESDIYYSIKNSPHSSDPRNALANLYIKLKD